MPKRIRLTPEERAIEAALLRGEYKDVPRKEFQTIARAVSRARRSTIRGLDAVTPRFRRRVREVLREDSPALKRLANT